MLKVHVDDWQDREFVHAFEAALEVARACRGDATVPAWHPRWRRPFVQSPGYREARVECRAAVDDVLSGVAHWTVRRGPSGDVAH
ncbi:MAG: hypothetical protein R3C32_04850 [Chloroflexota bacterium]